METTLLVIMAESNQEMFMVSGEGILIPRIGEHIKIMTDFSISRASYKLWPVRDIHYLYESDQVTVSVYI